MTTWPGKVKCDMWVGGGGCHEGGWVPWSRVGAMEQSGMCCGAGFHGAGLGPCSRAMLWAINGKGPFRGYCIIQFSPSQEPLADSPSFSTWPHPAPTGLAGCLSSLHIREARGTQKWGPLGSRFHSHLILCLWADDVPPPPAPFAHRTVTLRSASVSSQYSLSSKDILGG